MAAADTSVVNKAKETKSEEMMPVTQESETPPVTTPRPDDSGEFMNAEKEVSGTTSQARLRTLINHMGERPLLKASQVARVLELLLTAQVLPGLTKEAVGGAEK